MGEARRRGTFEQRRQESILKDANKNKREEEVKRKRLLDMSPDAAAKRDKGRSTFTFNQYMMMSLARWFGGSYRMKPRKSRHRKRRQ